MDAPKERSYERLNEIVLALAGSASVKKIFPHSSAGERTSKVRDFALVGLLFEARGRKQLLDKLETDHPELKEDEQAVDLLTTVWLLAAEEVLRHLRRIPRERLLRDVRAGNHLEFQGHERAVELMATTWLLGVEEILRYLRWMPE
jgi:hypothetical protein